MQKGAVFNVKTTSFPSVTGKVVLRTANLRNKNPLVWDKTRGGCGGKGASEGIECFSHCLKN